MRVAPILVLVIDEHQASTVHRRLDPPILPVEPAAVNGDARLTTMRISTNDLRSRRRANVGHVTGPCKPATAGVDL
jgi:hypothetical protein